jgi:preprotein translocase subunit SecY
VVSPGRSFEVLTVVTLVAGAIFLMWLAEQITERGIGDGVVLILACGVVSRLPVAFAVGLDYVEMGDLEFYWLPMTLAIGAAIVLLVVFVECAVRRIPVQYPRRLENGIAAATSRFAPLSLRINPSGILVPLAASVFATPLWDIAVDIGGHDVSWLVRLTSSRVARFLVEGLLIFFFALFFGVAAFDPERIAKELRDSGGWIPGFRPGDDTARYLRRCRAVLALIGAVYLVAVCVLPDVVYRWLHLPLLFSGFSFFLLAWVMVRIRDRMRSAVQS